MIEENKVLVRRFVEQLLNEGNTEVVDELAAPDFVDHDAPPDQPPGPEGIKAAFEEVKSILADIQVSTDDLIAEGDRVITRHTAQATHAGPFLGFAPPGKRLTWTTISIYRIAGGKIAER